MLASSMYLFFLMNFRYICTIQVSDIREAQYEKSGIGSSYLFRLDDDYVVGVKDYSFLLLSKMVRWIHIFMFDICFLDNSSLVLLKQYKKLFIYVRIVMKSTNAIF
jgi:hypothetical protein